jgi:lysophospholipase L1-like esterase
LPSEGSRRLKKIAAALLLAAAACSGQEAKTSYHFDFSRKAEAQSFLESPSDIRYGKGFVTSDKPFAISLPVPEGNYKVTVKLGDRHGSSTTTVKAELRRLMVEHLQTPEGKQETRTFIINVRRPQIGSTGEVVKFKEREKTSEARAWDDKLTLQFSDQEPKLAALTIEKAGNLPTIYIAGDSTSTDQGMEPYNSWGQMITAFFKPEVAMANNGESGETARSFIRENRFAKIMSVIKPGDYLLVQFGHNDQKEKGEGVGAFTAYKATLKQFVTEARRHGATPVLITSMNRRTFDADGKITNSLGDYPAAMRQLAEEEKVPLIDLNAMSKTLYEAFGPEASGKLFAPGDGTHHSDYGSYEMAKCVALGIKETKLPVAKYLINSVLDFDPVHPDPFDKFDVPPDPVGKAVKPYGS